MHSFVSRLNSFDWISECEARSGGLSFYFDDSLLGVAPPGQLHVFKSKRTFELYADILDGQSIQRVLELGIWKGGSALILAMLFDVEKLVAIDVTGPNAFLDDIIASDQIGNRVSFRYHVSQDSEAELNGIIDEEFSGPLDLIIDDASHFYGLSRASFEILFSQLRPGGWYIIEDWGWAHGEHGDKFWRTQPSLAGLIFELQLAWLGSPNLIGRVIVNREMVFLQKADAASVSRTRLSLEDLYYLHHRSAPLVV